MKLSDIFRLAADKLPKDELVGMCYVISKVFSELGNGISYYGEAFRKLRHKEINASFILKRFKPSKVSEYNLWFVTEPNFVLNAIVFDTVEEAQAKRKEILLKCAEIAESEEWL